MLWCRCRYIVAVPKNAVVYSPCSGGFHLLRRVGLSTSQSGSGLCPTRNRPDHFTSLKLGPTADLPEATVRVVGCRRFLVSFRLGSNCANRHRILPKSAYFCLIDRISKRSWRISMRLGQILKRSQQISTRSGPISKRSDEMSTRSRWILKRSGQISPNLDRSNKIDL